MSKRQELKPWEFYFGVIDAFKNKRLMFSDFHEHIGDKHRDYRTGDAFSYTTRTFKVIIKLTNKVAEKETVAFEYFNAGKLVKLHRFTYMVRKGSAVRMASRSSNRSKTRIVSQSVH